MLDNAVITSLANDSVRYARSLQRRRIRHQERAFVVEGLRAVEEGIKAGQMPAFCFYTLAIMEQPRGQRLLAQATAMGANVKAVSDAVMATLSDTVTPSGILAVFPIQSPPPPQPLSWVLIVDALRDPGNLGTILRSALAAGVELVVTTTGTADPFSPKVVRAAMGAHFGLSLLCDQKPTAVENMAQGMDVHLAVPAGGTPYWEVDWRRPTALLIGGEAEGVGTETERLATDRVSIPMRAKVESLNAAVAASILLFEASRQRFCGQR